VGIPRRASDEELHAQIFAKTTTTATTTAMPGADQRIESDLTILADASRNREIAVLIILGLRGRRRLADCGQRHPDTGAVTGLTMRLTLP